MFIISRSTNGNPRKNSVHVLTAVLKITLAEYCNDKYNCDQVLGKKSKSHITQNQANTTSG